MDNGFNIKAEYRYSREGGEPKNRFNLFYYAANGNNDDTIRFLSKNGLDINAFSMERWFNGDYYYTALDYAIAGKNKNTVNTIQNLGGMTFMDIFKKGNMSAYIKYLEAHNTVYKINDSNVRFRENPSLDGRIIDKLQKEELVFELNTLNENKDWRMICRMNGDVGYVSSQFTTWTANSINAMKTVFSDYIYN